MSELFSNDWMAGFAAEWNGDPALAGALAEIGFASTIAYGMKGDPAPKGVLVVAEGKVTRAGAYAGEPVNWDIRCTPEHWAKWMGKPPTMMDLGVAYTTGKMKFDVGDYAAMIKDPRMAGPFIKSFAAMSRVA